VAGVVLALAAVILGLAVLQKTAVAQFCWRFYVAPVLADAANQPVGDVRAAYNPVNTFTYASLLLLALFFILKALKKLRAKVDAKFCVSLLPFVLFGALARVLEDIGFFEAPVVYLFISPLIYVWLGLLALALLALATKLKKPWLLPLAGVVLLGAALAALGTRAWRFPCMPLLALALSAALTLGIVCFCKTCARRLPALTLYTQTFNVLLLFAHALDASATFLGVDFYGYREKHVLPHILISHAHTAAIMYPLKLLVLLFAIYALDVLCKNLAENARGLAKFCIFVLGLAPGVRDIVRVALGV
jgi:uncharacterized membrane protein